jgi:hypothetical protein
VRFDVARRFGAAFFAAAFFGAAFFAADFFGAAFFAAAFLDAAFFAGAGFLLVTARFFTPPLPFVLTFDFVFTAG